MEIIERVYDDDIKELKERVRIMNNRIIGFENFMMERLDKLEKKECKCKD